MTLDQFGRRSAKLLLVIAVASVVFFGAPAHAQSINVDLAGGGGGSGMTAHLVELTAIVTVLSLAPSLLVSMTAFTRIIIVLSLLRSGLGTQGTPPNTVLIGLALFLTFFVMEPTLDAAWSTGLEPMLHGQLGEIDGLARTAAPFHTFMMKTVRPADVQLFVDIAHLPQPTSPEATPWRVLIPGFIVGELRRAFEMGFLIYLPFMIIDIVISSLLMSLGMMMLPPSAISLPFKIIFFVLIDGWQLVAGSLVRSFGGG